VASTLALPEDRLLEDSLFCEELENDDAKATGDEESLPLLHE